MARRVVQPPKPIDRSSANRFLRSLSSAVERREDQELLHLQSSEPHDRRRAAPVPLHSAADEHRESEMMEAVALPRLHQGCVSPISPVLVSYSSWGLFQFDQLLFGETFPDLLWRRPISHPSSVGQHSSPQEYRLMGRSQASPLSVLKRAAHLPQSSSLQNSSDHPESDHIQRPPYTLSRIFLLLGGFFIIGVAPAARALPQQEGIDPTQTTSSFDWWPYPAWGASSLSAPVLMTAISTTLATTQSTVVPISTDSVIPIPSSSGSASFKEVVDIPTESTTGASGSVDTTIQITALPQSASTSSQDAPTASPRPSTFKPIYLLPVTIVGGAILGACVTAFLYSRRYNVRKPLLRGDSTSAGFPANRGYHGVEEWDDEEDKRDDDEKHFIAQPDDSGGNSGVDGGRSSSSNQYPESDTLKAKSDFSRARTRRTEYDDIDSWYAREGHIEEDSKAGLSDEEPFSPYARLSDFRKPRATSSGQELPDYDQDDPAQSLLPTSADRPGVFRRRVTPIHMRGHGRTDSNTVIQDVLRVPDTTLEGKLLPPSPASVYPEDEDLPLQKETPPLPRPSNYSPPWSSVYRYHENSHSRDLSQRQSQLAPSDLSSSNPPRFSTVGGGDSLDLNLVLEDERGPRVLPKRSGKVSKDFPASVSASSTFVNPPSRFAHKLEPDSQQASSRVDDILRRSWDQRDVSYQPSSPTGFGAIIDDRPEVHRPLYGARQMRDGGRTGTGQVKSGAVREEGESIEERLANLRRKDNRFDRT